jgi:hypothetical protein
VPSLWIERLRGSVQEAQPDPDAHGKLQVAVVGIVVLLGEMLRP